MAKNNDHIHGLGAYEKNERSNGTTGDTASLSLVALNDRSSDALKQSRAPRPDLSTAGPEMEDSALRNALAHSHTPRGLGKQGCMAAIDEFVLKPYFARHGISAPEFNSTYKFIDWFKKNDMGTVISKPMSQLRVEDLKPGDIVIPEKVDQSQHAMIVSRVPSSWGYPRGSLMFNGNTGLPMADGPGVPHFRAAQEVIGPGTDQYNYHHGQINSQRPTNPYLGGRVKILRFE